MKKPTRKTDICQLKPKGFTLIELVVSIAISSIVIGLSMSALVQTQNSFAKDQGRVAANQKLSTVLELIGREIRQAGELVVDPSFPTIQVKKLNGAANGPVSLIVYRSIGDPITMCRAYTAGTTVAELVFASDPAPNTNCQVAKPATPTVANTFSPKQMDWVNIRAAAPGGKSFGVVGNSANKIYVPFVFSSESAVAGTSTMNLTMGTDSFIPTDASGSQRAIAVGDSAYVVSKKEYLICNNNLVVRTNSRIESSVGSPACAAINTSTDPTGSYDVMATNVTGLTINMVTRPIPTPDIPNPPTDADNGNNAVFPLATRDWQNIKGVVVDIELEIPDTGQTPPPRVVAQSTFYPRNALSTR